ncbi:hypothetical protein EV144_1011413 [Flavobacterium sp. 270]|nr:hypothetical protein EV144_1011413 [Flavobacterium sp. 270]
MNYNKFSIQQNKKFKSGLQRVIDNRKDWENLKTNIKNVYDPLLEELKKISNLSFFICHLVKITLIKQNM